MLRPVLLLAVLIALVPVARAEERGWLALAQPGAIALMRHAIAPGTGDPPDFRLEDCSTQRNLDARGRAQARATGQAIRNRGLAISRIVTSQWCRARETAALLGLGPVEDLPSLNSFFAGRGDANAQTAATLDWLRTLSPDERVLMVTHQVNITALTGVTPTSGEIVIGRLDGVSFRVEGRITFPVPD